jgi:hypothetical protein
MYAAIQLHNLAARGKENNINCWRLLVRANLSQVILLTHRPASATKKHAHIKDACCFFSANLPQMWSRRVILHKFCGFYYVPTFAPKVSILKVLSNIGASAQIIRSPFWCSQIGKCCFWPRGQSRYSLHGVGQHILISPTIDSKVQFDL